MKAGAETGSRADADTASSEGGLSREVGLGMMAVYGAGTILGAGIYVLIGEVAGAAGYWAPLAFAVAAFVAAVNGMAYAELSTRMPHAGGPTTYVSEAFHEKWLTIGIGWAIVATGVVSAATITTGFSGYLSVFVDIPEWIVRTALLAVLTGVAITGAKQSAWFMSATTALGVLGLLAVIGVGFFGAEAAPRSAIEQAPSLSDLAVLGGVASAAFLAVYAFIGFEDMVHMAEEVKRPAKTMPAAIALAVGAAAILYLIVSTAALSVAAPDVLRKSAAPLVKAVEEGGIPGWPVAILSLWIILNGALAQLIMSSRVVYSLGQRDGAPGVLARVWERTDTPVRATIAAAVVALALALTLPLKQLASVTSFIMLIVFAASNVALITIERREPEAPFDTPRWLPYLGLVLSVSLMVATFFVGGGGH